MRKSFKLMGMMLMAGALAFSASSCKKNQETASTAVSLQTITEIDVDGDRAYIDYGDNNYMKWSEGDQIMVFNLNDDYTLSEKQVWTAAPGCEGQLTTIFSGGALSAPFSASMGYLYFYPAAKVLGDFQEGNRQDFEVPATQQLEVRGSIPVMDPTSLVMACRVKTNHQTAILQHIFGFANLKIKGVGEFAGKRVRNIVITSNDLHLTGNVSVKLPGVDPNTLQDLINQAEAGAADYMANLHAYLTSDEVGYYSYNQSKDITLDCSAYDNGNGYSMGGGTNHFIFTLRPGALIDGFTATVNFMDNTSTVITKFQGANSSYCVMPGYIKNFKLNY